MIWNARDSKGRELPTGMYIVLMVIPEFRKSIKLVLLKLREDRPKYQEGFRYPGSFQQWPKLRPYHGDYLEFRHESVDNFLSCESFIVNFTSLQAKVWMQQT